MTPLEASRSPDARVAAREFVAQVGRAAAFQLEACVHCGQCADACHFHLTSGDPRHTPVYKLRPMAKAYERASAPFAALRRALGVAPPELTAQELREWSQLLYDSCNLCGRCTLVCPMGIDIASLVRLSREAMTAGGFAPPDLAERRAVLRVAAFRQARARLPRLRLARRDGRGARAQGRGAVIQACSAQSLSCARGMPCSSRWNSTVCTAGAGPAT